MRVLSYFIVSLFVFWGCSVPVVPQIAAPEPQPLPPGGTAVTLRLSRVIIEMPKGAVVGQQRIGPECTNPEPLRWRSDTLVYNDGEYHSAFDVIVAHYNFVPKGGTTRSANPLFDMPVPQVATGGGELMLVGARITNVKQNDCLNLGLMNLGTPTHKGSARFSVHWEVYSPKEQKVLFTLDNEGSGISNTFAREGEPGYMGEAFASGLKGLLRDEQFRRLVSTGAGKK
jgi:hypothetical protein